MLLTRFDVTIFETTPEKTPELVLAIHSWEDKLTFGPYIILSCEGSQQGDPLSRLEFCDTVHPILAESQSKMKLGYMDDFKPGGKIQAVASDIQRIIEAYKRNGLHLNTTTCEIIAKNFDLIKNFQIFMDFEKVAREDLIILGALILKGPTDDKVCCTRKLKTWKGQSNDFSLMMLFACCKMLGLDQTPVHPP